MNYNNENTNTSEAGNSFSLKSIKRRFDLLFGNNNYTLDLISKNNNNLLKLKITL
jgi:hypothetical protein